MLNVNKYHQGALHPTSYCQSRNMWKDSGAYSEHLIKHSDSSIESTGGRTVKEVTCKNQEMKKKRLGTSSNRRSGAISLHGEVNE